MIVSVEEPDPGAEIEAGLNPTLAPLGRPEALREMALLNPPETVVLIVDGPDVPCPREREAGAAAIVKFGVTPLVMVREINAVSVRPPPVPVTVTVELPTVAAPLTVNVMVEEPAPLEMTLGLKVAVTPEGNPLADNETLLLKPPETLLVIVDAPELPCCTLTEEGLAVRAKLEPDTPDNVLIKVAPIGLPHPVTRSYPATALNPLPPPDVAGLLPLVMSWKFEAYEDPTDKL